MNYLQHIKSALARTRSAKRAADMSGDASKTMHVALLTLTFPPTMSGLSREISETAEALADEGIHVRVFTMDRDGRETLRDGKIEVIGCRSELGNHESSIAQLPMVRHIRVAKAFSNAVTAEHQKRPIDVIDVPNRFALGYYLTGREVPLVVRNVAPSRQELLGDAGAIERAERDFLDRREKRTAQLADAVISANRPIAESMRELYELPYGGIHRVVRPPVNHAFVEAGKTAYFPDLRGPLKLVFVGNTQARKGFDEALKAFEILFAQARADGTPRPELTIVGLDNETLHANIKRLGLSTGATRQITRLEAVFWQTAARHRALPTRSPNCSMMLRRSIPAVSAG